MKLMSFNSRGLAGPVKKTAFIRMLTLEDPDVILLQETLGVGEVIKERLELWLPRWSFITLDANGHSGGLAVGWRKCCVKLVSAWGMDSVLGAEFHSEELGFTFPVLNVYGPYLNRGLFWDNLLQHPLVSGDSLVMGGDFNFSLGQNEIWGPRARADPLTDYFIQKLVEKGLLDIEPVKLRPTWRNNRSGEARVPKRLDRFLITEQLVDRSFLVR